MSNLLPPHGGYEKLQSYQMSEIVFDLTVDFCQLYVDTTNKSYTSNKSYGDLHNRQADQMIQAARSGKQNIAEGSVTSGTSKQSELRLVTVARASLAELLADYKDFLRTKSLPLWDKNDPRTLAIRKLAYSENRTYMTYKSYMSYPEAAANCAICLINQTNYLLDQQIKALEKDLVKRGDFKDRYNQERKKQLLGPTAAEDREFLKQFGIKFDGNGVVIQPKPKENK